jgi:hypothetical protein
MPHADPALLIDPSRQGDQGVDQAEVVEGFRAQFARQAPHVLERALRSLGDLFERGPHLRRVGGGRGALRRQRHRGQGLTDFVVQCPRHPLALPLLRSQRHASVLTSLRLESIEHGVEALRQLAYLAVLSRVRGQAPAGIDGVDLRAERRQAM